MLYLPTPVTVILICNYGSHLMSGWRHRGYCVQLVYVGGDRAGNYRAPAARRMATHMYGGATVACRVCYRDQYDTPPELSYKLQRKWTNGYHLMFRLCQWKPNGGRSDGSLLIRRGCDVRCRSCNSCNDSCETKECESSENGAGPYRYVLTTSLQIIDSSESVYALEEGKIEIFQCYYLLDICFGL